MVTHHEQSKVKRRLKNKIIALFIGVCILLSVTFIIASLIYTRIAEEKVIAHTKNNLSQASNYISLLVNQASETAQYISQKTEVAAFANLKNPTPFEKYIALESIRQDIIMMSELDTNIDSIYVYFENVGIISTSTYGNYLMEVLEDSAVYRIIQSSNSHKWSLKYINDDLSKKRIVSFMVRGNNYNADIQSNVYLMINFKEETIYNIIKDINGASRGMPFLLSSDGEVVSGNDKAILGNKFFIDNDKFLKASQGYCRLKIQEQDVYAFIDTQYSNIFILVYLVPKDDMVIEKEIITVFMIVILIFFIAAGIVVNTIYMRGVYHPLMKLVNFMENAEKGNLSSKMDDDREDEFGYLYKTFNSMINRINTLIQTTHQQDELRRKMEIKELEKQIDPHFLYNTLDTVNWLAKKNNVPEISRIVLSLSNIYRNAFNKGNHLVLCKDVIESCKSYLEIQNIRFHGKFTYKIETDPKLDDCLVLNLLLQTLVENAVIHGFENMNKDGIIIIKNEYLMDEDAILFTVADNGQGMTEKKLKLLKQLLESDNIVSNSGLTNVQRRIKLYYGNQYGISIDSRLHEGTTVHMKIPRITNNMHQDKILREDEAIDRDN